jgi:hypothetical protein
MNEGRFDVTLATCEDVPLLPKGDRILQKELESLGVSVRVAIWTDRDVDWSASNLTVIRSTWDAASRFPEFESWLRRVESQTRIVNPVKTILWNLEKRYLLDLQKRGIEIIPTIYFPAKSHVSLKPTDLVWPEVVVKPSIGASSFAVKKFSVAEELPSLQAHVNSILERTGVLVQRLENAVHTLAERSLVFIGGEYSHAVRRVPFNTGDTPDTPEFDHEASEAEIAFATRVLEAGDCRKLAFARVDVVPGPMGPLLMELELIEPALFMTRSSTGSCKLASTIAAML